VPLEIRPPEGGRGPQGDNPGDSKGASRCRGAQFLKKHLKTMSISLRRNVRSDYGVPLGARRPPKAGPETSKRQPQTTQTVSVFEETPKNDEH
jgi:hypothetical protein